MRELRICLALAMASALVACNPQPSANRGSADVQATATAPTADLIARGEYLVRIGGCNDCHTEAYAERSGEVDPAQWLTGSQLGFNGPWGTTYASNLRLLVDGMDEAGWLAYTGNLRTRPIMPDFTLRAMPEDDRRAIYRLVKSLGPAGEPAPTFLPPGQVPPPPYYQLVLPEGAPPEPAAAPGAP